MPEREPPPAPSAYKYFAPITTRWMDNDVYGHVNNVAFYSFFDSAVNRYLIQEGGLDLERSPEIALVVASSCAYHAPVAYPAPLRAGVRVDKLSARSLTWGIAIFDEKVETAAAHGQVVHVFVDRVTRRPLAIPARMREALARITA
ncbi:MAG: acyl-CoA thioesterase [Deltaproteobacteria bacterium]|nr:acyl-CoA thioesterase [Deltaproteobacteria bacterium]